MGEAIARRIRRPLERHGRETVWALSDVSLEVLHGEALGLIGRNGAGKSTLLKILSRITEPTTGEVDLYGRVGSLLEVGTGFHAELTGRENIFLNGSILGMSRREIQRKLDEIVAFAEVERFLDTPVKRYSSGMYVRLAFAVAAHLEPEILLVDEVLAVGDAAFQRKCLAKMGEVGKEGRTVIFVSHNMPAVQSLCTRAVWLDSGRVVGTGSPAEVTGAYLKASFSTLTERVATAMKDAPGNDRVRIRSIKVYPDGGTAGDAITIRTPALIEVEYWNLVPQACLHVTLILVNEEGSIVFATSPMHERQWNGRPFPAGLFRSICRIPGDLLNDGTHRVQLLVVENETVVIYSDEEALMFEVRDSMDRRGAWHGDVPGAVRPLLEWTTELIEGSACPGAASPEVLVEGVGG